MLGYFAAAAIAGYQKYLSPFKGFHCAYRCHTGRVSCSEYARRVSLRLGILALWSALPRQFARCRQAYQALLAAPADAPPHRRKRQKEKRRSDCDPCDAMPRDSCDVPCDAGPCDCSP